MENNVSCGQKVLLQNQNRIEYRKSLQRAMIEPHRSRSTKLFDTTIDFINPKTYLQSLWRKIYLSERGKARYPVCYKVFKQKLELQDKWTLGMRWWSVNQTELLRTVMESAWFIMPYYFLLRKTRRILFHPDYDSSKKPACLASLWHMKLSKYGVHLFLSTHNCCAHTKLDK